MSAYDFIDTTEATETSTTESLPTEAVWFNGVCLDSQIDGFRTLSVQGREVAEKDVKTYDTKSGMGEMFREAYYKTRTITVLYQLIAETAAQFRERYNLLNQLLSPEQAKLAFNDELDKYFIATKESNDDVDAGLNCVTGKIEFFCSDPRKYSTTTKTFQVTKVQQFANNPSIVIKNDGNVPVPINYDITMESDNGYIGLMHYDTGKIIQLGSIEEADGEDYKQSEILTDTAEMFATANDAAGTACVSDTSFTVNGQLGNFTPSESSRTWLGLLTDVSGTGWHGGQRTIAIDADSEGNLGASNFFCYFRRWFQKGKVGQIGFQSIFFLDENKNPICGTRLGAYNSGDWKASLDFVIGGKKVKTISATANDQSSSMWRESNGHDSLTKEGEKFIFHYGGKYYTFVDDSYTSTAIRYIQINISNYSTKEQMTRNYIGVLTFTKNNVSKWKDNPNRYANGDVVKITGNDGKVYVNDLVRLGDEVIGSEYFMAQPGQNIVRVYNSTWATDVLATATIREAWI